MRAVASLVDVIALGLFFLLASTFFGISPFSSSFDSMSVFDLLFVRLPWFLYSPVIEYVTNGRSIGKWIMGIRVVAENGEVAGLRAYFTRWIFRVVDIWVGGFGALALFFSGTSQIGQRLGDKMAQTVVIRTKSTLNYSIEALVKLKAKSNHVVSYPKVVQFNDEQMMQVKTVLQRAKKFSSEENNTLLTDLSLFFAHQLEVDTPKNHFKFVQTVLQDYVVLTR